MTNKLTHWLLPRVSTRYAWAWLLFGVALVFWIVQGTGLPTSDRGLPAHFAIERSMADVIQSPEPILVKADKLLNLTDEMALSLVLPNGTAPSEVMRQFRSGKGTPLGKRESLSDTPDLNASSSLYVWLAYKTDSQDPPLLRYRSLSQLLGAVWLSDDSAQSFRLVGLAGPDAPIYKAALSDQEQFFQLKPSITLPASTNQPLQVLVRIDSIFPYWSNFSLHASGAYERVLSQSNYLDGVVLGALLVATAFAVYGIYYRQTIDYMAFLLATSAMCISYLVRGEHFYGSQIVFFRRLMFFAPVYIYFLFHSIGLQRILYPKILSGTKTYGTVRSLPLWLSLAYCGIGLSWGIAYGLLGLQTPGALLFNELNEWILFVAPALLLLTVVLAPDKQIPAYWLLLLVEIVGALGTGLQFIHFHTPLLDNWFAEVLIQYTLPIEVLIWAAALSSRYNYLELIAKRRVKAALRAEGKKARAAMQTTLQSREQALAALDNSYRALDHVRNSILGIIDTHSHAANNLLMRIGIHMERMGRSNSLELTQHLNAASTVLDDLATAIQDTERAVEDAQSSQFALAPAASLLKWQTDVFKERLRRRGVSLHVNMDADCEILMVDGYHFMEVTRELLSNINRYAMDGSSASISLQKTATNITVCAENTAILRVDDQALRLGWPVSPAASTLSGEQSSGRGLATLGTLLTSIGGSIKYDTRPPSQVIVTAVLPCR